MFEFLYFTFGIIMGIIIGTIMSDNFNGKP